jgi:hypothetical protein
MKVRGDVESINLCTGGRFHYISPLILRMDALMADICVLTSEEVGRLRHYKIFPNHQNHTHISHEDAILGLKDEDYEYVEGINGGRSYLTKTKLHFLCRVKSGGKGGIPIVQRVVSNHLVHLMPIR